MLPRAVLTACLVLAPGVAAQCDWTSTACQYNGDGECDAVAPEGETAVCPANSDCLDCDACKQFVTCGDCLGAAVAGCVWCEAEAYCAGTALAVTASGLLDYPLQGSKTSQCSGSDWVAAAAQCPTPAHPYNDAAYGGQEWVYDMVKVKEVWQQGITGAGVVIHVNDDGVDATHPDFASKFSAALSCATPSPIVASDSHGTVCAGIAAGSANGACSVGIAHEATVSACNVIGTGIDPTAAYLQNNAFMSLNIESIDVSSNSWGIDACSRKGAGREASALQAPCPFRTDLPLSPCGAAACGAWGGVPSDGCKAAIVAYCTSGAYEHDVAGCAEFLDLFVEGCQYSVLSDSMRTQLTKGITAGRGGKGTVFVFASGNSHQIGSDTNMEGMMNTRFTVSVGAVGKKGKHSSYSTTGASLLVSAPGGDGEFLRGHITAHPGGACKDAGVGTSYACPVVSGVAALMLEARPALSWRDVQGILVATSQGRGAVDAGDPGWVTNAAGHTHNNKYGFGIVDAAAAVAAAKVWTLYTAERQVMGDSGALNLAIPDNGSAVTTKLAVAAPAGTVMTAESVVLYLDLSHPSRGDLEIILTSPRGTPSVLHPPHRPEATQAPKAWKLMTVRAWGENAAGAWTLSIADKSAGVVKPCVDSPGAQCEGVVADGVNNCASAVAPDAVTGSVACCACGGGTPAAEVPAQLRSAKVIVYGAASAPPLPSSPPAPRPPTVPPTPITRAPPLAPPPFTPPTGGPVPPPAHFSFSERRVGLTLNTPAAAFLPRVLEQSITQALQLPADVTPRVNSASAERGASVLAVRADTTFTRPAAVGSREACEMDAYVLQLHEQARTPGSRLRLLQPQVTDGVVIGTQSAQCETYTARRNGNDDDDDGMSRGWIIGIAAGGAACLIIIMWVAACLAMRKGGKKRTAGQSQGTEPSAPQGSPRTSHAPSYPQPGASHPYRPPSGSPAPSAPPQSQPGIYASAPYRSGAPPKTVDYPPAFPSARGGSPPPGHY